MGAQGWVDILARWVHIVSVVAWSGGAIFVASALRPAVGDRGGDSAAVARKALQRYRPIVATATILVLVSGFAILAVRLSYVGVGNLGTAYHVVFGIKLLVALGLIGLAHAGFARSAAAETDEQAVGAAVTPTVALVAALVVMLLGIALHRL